jgi:hypothetical protein
MPSVRIWMPLRSDCCRQCAGVRIEPRVVETVQQRLMRRADRAFREQLFHQFAAFHALRCRTDRRDKFRITNRRLPHLVRLRQRGRHACLREDMLPVLQRVARHLRVHVGMRADPDDIDLGTRRHLLPALHRLRFRRELAAERLRAGQLSGSSPGRSARSESPAGRACGVI